MLIRTYRNRETDLNGAVEDATNTNTVFEDPVDLHNSVVRFVGSTVRHIVYVKFHLRHHHRNPRSISVKLFSPQFLLV